MSRKLIDLTGQKFGRLTVIKRTGTSNGHALWRCICICNRSVDVVSGSLRNGLTKSCGCLSIELTKKRASAKRNAVKRGNN